MNYRDKLTCCYNNFALAMICRSTLEKIQVSLGKHFSKCRVLRQILKAVVGSLLTAAELKFQRISLWSMVSIFDWLQRFSFQFIKNSKAAM